MKTEADKKKLKEQRRMGLLIGFGVIMLLCGIATCGALISAPSVELRPSPTWVLLPTLTPTLESPRTPRPTATPTMAPPKVTTGPVTLAEVSGIGDTVTDNFVWPQCQKAVFHWSVEPNSHGSTFLIVHLWNIDKDKPAYLVNAGETDRSEVLEGQTLQRLAGGEYYFTTENATGAWSITVVCED